MTEIEGKEGPFQVQMMGDCAVVVVGNIGLDLFSPGQMKRETPAGAAKARADALNTQVFSWLKSRGWAGKWAVDGLKSQVTELEKERNAARSRVKEFEDTGYVLPDIWGDAHREVERERDAAVDALKFCEKRRDLAEKAMEDIGRTLDR